MDLADFTAGETNHSPRLVMALIRGLPEDSRWTKHLEATVEGAEELRELLASMSPEERARADAEFWNPDRMLMATLINAIYQNTQATGNWKDGKPPEMPFIGPEKWREEPKAPAPAEDEQPTDLLMHHMSRLGMPTGGGRMRF